MGGKEAKERRRLKRLAERQHQQQQGQEGSAQQVAAAADIIAVEQQPKKNPTSPAIAQEGQDARSSKSISSRKKQRNSKSRKKAPKPGEEGYLTPTQLRNARKRRAKQQKSRTTAAAADADADATTSTTANGAEGNHKGNKRSKTTDDGAQKRQQQKKQGGGRRHHQGQDPSLKFVRNPQGAPIVQAARRYFATKAFDVPPHVTNTNTNTTTTSSKQKFRVYLDETEGWRTVCKLAVRRDPSNHDQVIIGLFQPQSHEIVSVPDCRAHHPSINAAVKCLTTICNKVGVVPYDEKTGAGYLRYVALTVERGSGKIQLTLVWNSAPYHEGENTSDDHDDDVGKIMLEKLIREIRKVSSDGDRKRKRRRGRKKKEEGDGGDDDDGNNSNKSEPTELTPAAPQFQLHSLWVHYNSTWRHSNAIFDVAAPASSWRHVCGPEYVEETLRLSGQSSPIALRFPPNVFRQANIDAFTGIVSAIRSRLERYNKERDRGNNNGNDDGNTGTSSPSASCLELYGGVGTIGLNVADLVSSLTSSDENPNNAACFLGSADASLPDDTKSGRVSYESKNATDMVREGRLDHAEVLIVDPPRKGFDEVVLSALTDVKEGRGPKLIAYVSCGFDAFQRDCDALLESGKWKLDHAEGHLLFPGSDAIETLAYFVRK